MVNMCVNKRVFSRKMLWGLLIVSAVVYFSDRRFYIFSPCTITLRGENVILGPYFGLSEPKSDYIHLGVFDEFQIRFLDKYHCAIFSTAMDSCQAVANLNKYCCVDFENKDIMSFVQKYPVEKMHSVAVFSWDLGRYYPILIFRVSKSHMVRFYGQQVGPLWWDISIIKTSE